MDASKLRSELTRAFIASERENIQLERFQSRKKLWVSILAGVTVPIVLSLPMERDTHLVLSIGFSIWSISRLSVFFYERRMLNLRENELLVMEVLEA